MQFNKCGRCGCFFTSSDSLCPNCISKDEIDKRALKTFLSNNDLPRNAEDLAYKSGISLKNINRFLSTEEFEDLQKSFNEKSVDPKIEV